LLNQTPNPSQLILARVFFCLEKSIFFFKKLLSYYPSGGGGGGSRASVQITMPAS
tara:strand:+ start:404 stop:568 length:165 start_codon:yes stop_codon:yes gene_type:complete